jgi:hypothetical protein
MCINLIVTTVAGEAGKGLVNGCFGRFDRFKSVTIAEVPVW